MLQRRLLQAAELAQVVVRLGGLYAFLTWKPFSITAYRMLRSLKAQGIEPRTILDGGANIGQFARAAVANYPEASIHSFEALPEIATKLQSNLRKFPEVNIIASALGNHEGTLRFRRNAYAQASSALPVHKNKQESFPDVLEREITEVSVNRLENLIDSKDLVAPVLLKLDLQGYELEALKGSTELLPHIQYVLVETAFKQMYVGEPLFEDILIFLLEYGFHFLRPVDFLKDARGNVVQMDALFARTQQEQHT